MWYDTDRAQQFELSYGKAYVFYPEVSDELELLLEKLGYSRTDGVYAHPEGRKAAFVGDFCDRGNRNADVLRIVMDMVKAGSAIAVPGNHDVKLLKYLNGKKVNETHGLDKTIAELEKMGEDFKAEVREFIDGLISYYVLDDGKLVIAHAGLKQKFIGRGSQAVREFCLYGERTGEFDEYGLPVRLDWADDYRGNALVATATSQAERSGYITTLTASTLAVFSAAS